MKKKIKYSVIALTIAGIITGCGSSGGSSGNSAQSSQSSSNTTKSVKVADGYIIGAQVCDTDGDCATTNLKGVATANFANTVLTSKGGYIDVNNNAQFDQNIDIELPSTFTLKTPAGENIITPLTDLIANGANPEKLAQILNVNVSDLYTDPIATNNVGLEKAIQIVYALKVSGKESSFIDEINEYNTSINNSSNVTNTQSSSTSTSELPSFRIVTKADTTPPVLPSFRPDTTENNNTTTVNTNTNVTVETNNTVKINLDTFAQLAYKVAESNETIKNFITDVIDSNATSPVELEEKLANQKKEILSNLNSTTNIETNSQTQLQNQLNETENNNTVVNTNEQNTTNELNTTSNSTQQTQINNSNSSSALPSFR